VGFIEHDYTLYLLRRTTDSVPGKASRKNPLTRRVTSIRGWPSSEERDYFQAAGGGELTGSHNRFQPMRASAARSRRHQCALVGVPQALNAMFSASDSRHRGTADTASASAAASSVQAAGVGQAAGGPRCKKFRPVAARAPYCHGGKALPTEPARNVAAVRGRPGGLRVSIGGA